MKTQSSYSGRGRNSSLRDWSIAAEGRYYYMAVAPEQCTQSVELHSWLAELAAALGIAPVVAARGAHCTVVPVKAH